MDTNVYRPRGERGTLFGFPLRRIALVTLTIQNTALILLLFYSRSMPITGTQRYFPSTAVFLNEIIKFTISITFALYHISRTLSPSLPATSLFTQLCSSIFSDDSWKIAIPAVLYTITNSLQYVAVSNLEAATMQVTYQFKIIPTALFSVWILNRTLTLRRWIALLIVIVGVAIVQMPGLSNPLPEWKDVHLIHFPRSLNSLHKRSATYEGIEDDLHSLYPTRNHAIGFASVIFACIAASLASVYFEKILKESHSHVNIWVRNVQLSIYSIFPAFFIGVLFIDGEDIAKHGFFVGYNWVVWLVVFTQAIGGIIGALCIHYADNILKSFAISISVLISLVASIFFFDFQITPHFIIGTLLVLYSVYLYNTPGAPTLESTNPVSEKQPIKTTPGHRPPNLNLKPSEKGGNRDVHLVIPSAHGMESGLSTSRPASPGQGARHARSYFERRDE